MFLLHLCVVSDVFECGSQTQKLLERANIQLTIHTDSMEGQGTEDDIFASQDSRLIAQRAEETVTLGGQYINRPTAKTSGQNPNN